MGGAFRLRFVARPFAGAAIAAALVAGFFTDAAFARETAPPAAAAPHAGLLVTTDDGLAASALEAAPPTGADVEKVAGRVAAVRVRPGDERGAAAALRARPGVRVVEPDWLLRPQAEPDDPAFARQWAHERTGVAAAWDTRTDARAARIAIIDTGVHAGHPDLAGQVTEQVDLSTGTLVGGVRRGVDNDPCEAGHGTWVAGVASGAGNNGTDVTGVAWQADLLDIGIASKRRGASCDGLALSRVIAGIDYAVHGTDRPAAVISISLGGYTETCPRGLQAAIDEAWSAGAVVIASSGNGELDPDTAGEKAFPASCERVVSVGATGPRDLRAPYSTRNDAVDIAAPGGDATLGQDELILTTDRRFARDKATHHVQGTSFAAPYVAGVVALLRAERPDLAPADVVEALLTTARDLGLPGRDADHGAGMVDPTAALAAVRQGAPVAPQPPASEPLAEDEPEPDVRRVSDGSGRTGAVEQAVAVSRLAFGAEEASHAVLARGDAFADALAGSALGMGKGPLLFTSDDVLPAATRTELQRVLPDGAHVYLLGGAAAVPASVEDDVRALGFRPVRLAGPSREETAVGVAREVVRLRAALGVPSVSAVLLATRDDWPDAVAGGSLAAMSGAPVLLTPSSELPQAVRGLLGELRPARVTVLGGEGAVSEPVAEAARAAAGGALVRLSGPARDETAVAIGKAARAVLDERGAAPRYAVAVNLRRADGFAHALSASVLSGVFHAVLVPVEESDGSVLTAAARDWVAGELGDPGTDVLLAGEPDVLAERVGEELQTLMTRARAARD